MLESYCLRFLYASIGSCFFMEEGQSLFSVHGILRFDNAVGEHQVINQTLQP
jgi:hypothetical protein